MYNILSDLSRLDKSFSISTVESYNTKMKTDYFTILEKNLQNSGKLQFYQNFRKRHDAENYLEMILSLINEDSWPNLDWVATSWSSKQEDTANQKPQFSRNYVSFVTETKLKQKSTYF